MDDKTNAPDEILDLVDEKDIVIGEVKKSAANQNPNLIHREVSGIIYDDRRRIIIQRRSLEKRVQPGYWQTSFAGHVPSGMTAIEAAHKELLEEIGFDTFLKFIEKVLQNRPNETHFTSRYLGKYFGETLIRQESEVEEIRLVSEEELNQMLAVGQNFNPSSLMMFKRFWAGEFDHFL